MSTTYGGIIMSDTKYCKLIMVTENNNNKYYEMQSDGTTISIKFGRIQGGAQTTSKPHSHWDKIYKSKIKKGYKDVTPTAPTIIKSKTSKKSHPFLDRMMNYRNDRVSSTYMVSANDVTDSQKTEAQNIITELTETKIKTKKQQEKTNKLLLDLYTIIPRKMRDTRDHLFPSINDMSLLIQTEQDNLDSISSVVIEANEIGIDITDKFENESNIKYLVDQLTQRTHKVHQIKCNKEDTKFTNWMDNQDNKDTKYLIHGTRCSSVIPIIETGLQIRPSGNFHFAGKVYGNGNYFSEVVQKSLNYTGYDKDKILLVYEVHVGNPFIYEGWYRAGKTSQALEYDALKKNGYDSTYVKAGDGLLNSEIIAYKEQQSRLSGVIWLH